MVSTERQPIEAAGSIILNGLVTAKRNGLGQRSTMAGRVGTDSTDSRCCVTMGRGVATSTPLAA